MELSHKNNFDISFYKDFLEKSISETQNKILQGKADRTDLEHKVALLDVEISKNEDILKELKEKEKAFSKLLEQKEKQEDNLKEKMKKFSNKKVRIMNRQYTTIVKAEKRKNVHKINNLNIIDIDTKSINHFNSFQDKLQTLRLKMGKITSNTNPVSLIPFPIMLKYFRNKDATIKETVEQVL